MSIKELNTRIALRYDSYLKWTDTDKPDQGGNLVLLPGEIGICELPAPNEASNVAPTVLFKVGGTKYPATQPDGSTHPKAGQLMAFKDLPWASAKAADVYSWAKAETVVLENGVIKFKTGDNLIHFIDLSTAFASTEDLTDLAARVADLEADGSTGGSITDTQLSELNTRLDDIEDQIDAVSSNATAYTNAKVAELNEKYTDQAATIAALDQTIEAEIYGREQADLAINCKIGEGFSETATVKAAIDTAAALGQKGIDDAASVQTALITLTTSGQVATNTSAIATLTSDVNAAIAALEDDTTGLDRRVQCLEVFFDGADYDGQDNSSLLDALDTLVEIQKYLAGEGSAADGVLSRIASAESNIAALQNTLASGGAFEQRVADSEANIAANSDAISILQSLTKDFEGEGAIKIAVSAAQESANQGISDAASAKATAETALTTANSAENKISAFGTLLDSVKASTENAVAEIADLDSRLTTTAGSVSDIQAIVVNGDNSNEKLREAITALQELTGDRGTLQEELAELQEAVKDNTDNVSDALARVAAIEADYLSSVDEFIFQCGTSANTFTANT